MFKELILKKTSATYRPFLQLPIVNKQAVPLSGNSFDCCWCLSKSASPKTWDHQFRLQWVSSNFNSTLYRWMFLDFMFWCVRIQFSRKHSQPTGHSCSCRRWTSKPCHCRETHLIAADICQHQQVPRHEVISSNFSGFRQLRAVKSYRWMSLDFMSLCLRN